MQKYDPIGRIIARVAAEFGLEADQLIGRSQVRDIAEARAAAAYVIRVLLPAVSLVTIGQRFGGRDHTTIIHALEKVQERMDASTRYADTLAALIAELTPTMPALRTVRVPRQHVVTPQLRLALTLYGILQPNAA
jgi:chromosomal replication initiation ATPase DnaA